MKKYIFLDYFSDNIPKGIKKINYDFIRFKCGENAFLIKDKINSNDNIYIYQSFSNKKINEELIKLSLCLDVLEQNKVKNITYIAPFLPYIRQDDDKNKKCSLGCKILSNIINTYNVSTIYSYDLHSTCFIENIFNNNLNKIKIFKKNDRIIYSNKNKKLIALSAMPLFIKYIKKYYNLNNMTVLFPDLGALKRFSNFIEKKINMVYFKKVRIKNKVKFSIHGKIKKNNYVVIFDDMIDTGKTIIGATKEILNFGVKNIIVCATHGIFSSNSIKVINNNPIIEKVLITDSKKNKNLPKKFDIIKLPSFLL